MSRMMRRRFLQSLGLGAGATVLHPIARTLIGEVDGQPPLRRRALIVVHGVMNYRLWAPGPDRWRESAQTLTDFDWPTPLASLETRRSEMLVLDNLHCDISRDGDRDSGINHGLGYGFLSCVRPEGEPKDLQPPRAKTIDQHLAETLSADAPRKSVLFGLSGRAVRRELDEEMNLFARGPREPLPHVTKASVLFRRLFGEAEGGPTAADLAAREQRLTDLLHADLRRLRSRLAGPERERLESYERAFVEFDRRRSLEAAATCDRPGAPRIERAEDHMRAMMEMGALALKCGMTNVVAVNVGASDSHNDHMPRYSFHEPFEVHADGDLERQHLDPLRQIWDYDAQLALGVMDELEATPEGDGTALDGTLVAMTSARGIRTGDDTHHAPVRNGSRYPVLLAGRPPGLRLDGRYIGYELGTHGMVDLWRTCCDALGVPSESFAPEARNARGRLSELL